ncbi:MAG: bifunctional (p)ppGpp synthetase/guanosine-3',5'-bis(diphosphate) 3'-pyrophosphohydrolase [Candidatus Pacebacteria bacterium]|nr:bifunctional (p)ppGpp synthetase/guanosine-3',5'-bis(diphosphate) 3'-pyrophosphohydrolase [Candidatus Paceibacterota bacterium]
MEATLIEKAIRMATSAHEGQMRKDGPPYIIHPVAVSLMLARHGFAEAVIAAALVHDVLEDTPVTADEMREELGQEVLGLVQTVSYDKTLSWEDQRIKYVEAVRAGSDGAKAISVADKIHNAESLLMGYQKEGKTMWSHFNRSRDKKLWFEEEMLKMLRESWHHPLVKEYAVLVEKLKNLEY